MNTQAPDISAQQEINKLPVEVLAAYRASPFAQLVSKEFEIDDLKQEIAKQEQHMAHQGDLLALERTRHEGEIADSKRRLDAVSAEYDAVRIRVGESLMRVQKLEQEVAALRHKADSPANV